MAPNAPCALAFRRNRVRLLEPFHPGDAAAVALDALLADRQPDLNALAQRVHDTTTAAAVHGAGQRIVAKLRERATSRVLVVASDQATAVVVDSLKPSSGFSSR